MQNDIFLFKRLGGFLHISKNCSLYKTEARKEKQTHIMSRTKHTQNYSPVFKEIA